MPTFTASSIAEATTLINNIDGWIQQVNIYISPIIGDYTSTRQSQSVIIQGDNIGATCPVANISEILGNQGLFNNSVDVFNELTSINSLLNTTMSDLNVSKVQSAFSSFVSWAKNVNQFLASPIPNIHITTGAVLFAPSNSGINTTGTIFNFCGIIPPSSLISTGNDLINRAQNVLNFVNDPEAPEVIPEPVDTVMAPITVPENGASRLFELMERLYKKINNEHYIIITRANQINVNVLDLAEYIGQVLAGLKGIQTNVYENRTELKEARQGIKDLLGLGDKFYEGSVSTIELLERMNAIHQSENDVLYEIRVRVTENNSYLEAIRNDTIDIDDKITELNTKLDTLNTSLAEVSNKITENFTQTNEYISTVLNTMEGNILARIEQMRQEQYQYTVDIIERINVIDTSVG